MILCNITHMCKPLYKCNYQFNILLFQYAIVFYVMAIMVINAFTRALMHACHRPFYALTLVSHDIHSQTYRGSTIIIGTCSESIN